jgi:hypothetical protein
MINHKITPHVKTLIPVWIQCLLDDAGSVGLFRVDSDNSEGVWEAENITLGESIGRDH